MNQVVTVDRLPSLPAGGPVRAIVPQDFEGAWRIASAVCKAGMAPRGLDQPERAMVAIMHGLEVGLTPMNALQSIAIVNGRPTIWGDGAIGLARGSGLLEFMEEKFEGAEGSDTFKAVCLVKRKGEPKPVRGEFSIGDAKRAGLWGKAGPWQQYHKRMLQMRARAFALRDGFADVLKGLSIKEEVEDYQHQIAPASAREEPPAPAMPSEISRAEGEAQHRAEVSREEHLAESGRHDPATVEWTDEAQEAAAPDEPPEPPSPTQPTQAADDFPGDRRSGEMPDIPPALRRTTKKEDPITFNAPRWLEALGNALSGCEDTDQLAAVQDKYQRPYKSKVAAADWEKSRQLVMDSFARISKDD